MNHNKMEKEHLQMSITEELMKLETLRQSGTLSDQEFEKAKALILNGNVSVPCHDCKKLFTPDQLKDTKVSKTSVGYSTGGAIPVMSQEMLKLCENCAKKRQSNEYYSTLILVMIIIGVVLFFVIRKLTM